MDCRAFAGEVQALIEVLPQLGKIILVSNEVGCGITDGGCVAAVCRRTGHLNQKGCSRLRKKSPWWRRGCLWPQIIATGSCGRAKCTSESWWRLMTVSSPAKCSIRRSNRHASMAPNWRSAMRWIKPLFAQREAAAHAVEERRIGGAYEPQGKRAGICRQGGRDCPRGGDRRLT